MFIPVTRSVDGIRVWINTDNVLGLEPKEEGAVVSFALSLLEVKETPYMIIARIREQENLR